MPPTAEDQKKDDLKAASERQERDRAAQQSAVGGAQAVADAVKRVADEAVAAAQRAGTAGPVGNFVISGSPGGRFTIRGDGFTGSGTVSLNGVQLVTDEWGGQLIRGKLPADAKSGEVVVKIDESTEKRGYLKV
jgi:hypothetical protein